MMNERHANFHSSFIICLTAACHQEADLLLCGLLRVNLADDAAVVEDEQAVGERGDLLKLGGDEEDGAALVAQLDQLAVDELDGADAHAARRLRDEQELRVEAELAADDELLLGAARERGRREGGGRGTHGEVGDELLSPRADAREV